MDGSVRKTRISGINFDNISRGEAERICLSAAEGRGRAYTVVTPNIEIAMRARGDARLRADLSRADLTLCDGIGIFLLSALIPGTERIKERVPGIDLFEHLLPRFALKKMPLYLLGGRKGVAQRAAKKLAASVPGLVISGVSDGYGDLRDAKEMILNSGASVVAVCLGSPLQERFADELKTAFMSKKENESAPSLLILCLGGTLDVTSGDKKRAPGIFRRAGLEWLWRFAHEPERIIRFLRAVK